MAFDVTRQQQPDSAHAVCRQQWQLTGSRKVAGRSRRQQATHGVCEQAGRQAAQLGGQQPAECRGVRPARGEEEGAETVAHCCSYTCWKTLRQRRRAMPPLYVVSSLLQTQRTVCTTFAIHEKRGVPIVATQAHPPTPVAIRRRARPSAASCRGRLCSSVVTACAHAWGMRSRVGNSACCAR